MITMQSISKIWNGKSRGIISLLVKVLSTIIYKINKIITTKLFVINIRNSGKGISVGINLKYTYPTLIELGNNIIIGNNVTINTELKDLGFLKIEDGVSIGTDCTIDITGGIIIKKEAHIAHGVLISTHDHGYNYKNPPIGHGIVIGENVFVGNRVIVLSGCNYIGNNSVIGAGSIVTKDIPDNVIVVGNPAKILKTIK